jgi:hypothetical protein
MEEYIQDVDIIRDKFNFLLSNFNNSFSYRRPRSASDVVSERSRRSNAPSSSIPSGYSAEPGSAESSSQRGSVVSELVYDPYSAQAQEEPRRRKSVDIMDLRGPALNEALGDMFPGMSELSQKTVLLKDIYENTDEIEKFIKNKLNRVDEKIVLKDKQIGKIRKLVDELAGTFTRFLNDEQLNQIDDKTLLRVYGNNPELIDDAYLGKIKLYNKMRDNIENYDAIKAAAAAGKKRISKKQLYNILKNKTTKSTSTIKKLDTDILKILNS